VQGEHDDISARSGGTAQSERADRRSLAEPASPAGRCHLAEPPGPTAAGSE
jgi:hypothetical protein